MNESDSPGATVRWAHRPNTVTQAGEWTMVTGVYNNDTKQIQLYVNGRLLSTKSFAGVPWDAAGRLTVGAYDFAGNPGHFFKGTIDDVRLWQRALTASQVAAMAGLTHTNSTWVDGPPADGVATGGVSLVADTDAAKAQFDGNVGSRVTWPRPGRLRTDGSFSVEAWVRNDALAGGTGTAVSIDDTDHMPVSLDYHPEWGGRWTFTMTHGPNTPGRWLASDSTPVHGRWTHLAGTYDATTGTACFYVDGQLQHTEIDATWNPANVGGCSTGVVGWNNVGSFVVGAGRWNEGWANPWHGGIAGVRWYSGIRSVDQIRDDRTADDPGALFGTAH